MALNIAVAVADDPIANDSIVIGVDDLPGITANELNQDIRIVESKFIYSYLNKLYDYVAGAENGFLGLNATKAAPVGAGNDLLNQNFSATFIYYAHLANNTLDVFTSFENQGQPVNYGIGGVFPSVQTIAGGDNSPVDGIAIPINTATFGSVLGITTNPLLITNERLALASLTTSLLLQAPRRVGGNNNSFSAVTAVNRGNAVGFNVPANYYTGNNPITDFPADDLQKIAPFSITLSATVQLKLNQQSQTFDVHVIDGNGAQLFVLEPQPEPEPPGVM